METAELAELLQKSREDNDRLGLSGMLLYSEGHFFQVLEGPADVVGALYARIEQDTRHDQVTAIIREPISKRHFDAWTMGFATLSRDELAGIAGVNDFFGTGHCFTELGAGRAKKLLAAFAAGRWRLKLSGSRQAPVTSI